MKITLFKVDENMRIYDVDSPGFRFGEWNDGTMDLRGFVTSNDLPWPENVSVEVIIRKIDKCSSRKSLLVGESVEV